MVLSTTVSKEAKLLAHTVLDDHQVHGGRQLARTLAHAEQVVVDQALGHLEVLQALRLLHLVLQLRCVSEQTISQHAH